MHSIFWFRTRQWVLSRVLHLTEHKKQTLLAAPDAVLLLPALFRKRRISRILLVTTPRLYPPRNTDVSAGWL